MFGHLTQGITLLTVVCFLTTGCGPPSGGSVAQLKAKAAKCLLGEEPQGALGILEAKETLVDITEPTDIVVLGRIGGSFQSVWDPDRAAFMVQDVSVEEGAGGHDDPGHEADACPFCRNKKKKALAALALIQLVDEQGTVLPMDARDLLGLQEGQTLVARGRGKFDGLGNLVVSADGIFVRP